MGYLMQDSGGFEIFTSVEMYIVWNFIVNILVAFRKKDKCL